MNEIRRDEIIYEEGWRDIPVKDVRPEPDDELPDKAAPKPSSSKPMLILIQLALCAAAALALFILKAMNSEPYAVFMDYYHEEMNKTLLSREVFDSVELPSLFSSGTVRVTATPDETETR